jgi:hypothetical protein
MVQALWRKLSRHEGADRVPLRLHWLEQMGLRLPKVRAGRHAFGKHRPGGRGMTDLYLVPVGKGVLEYRMRCRWCSWSGPWSSFVEAHNERESFTIHLCESCARDIDCGVALKAIGWRWW